MDLAGRVEALIGPIVEAMGFSLVRVQILGRSRPRLQVMAERTDGESMLVEDCAAISRAVSAVLDVEDPIAGAFILEVSSPGIDRPLVRLADFDRFVGFEAKVEMDLAVDGRRRFQGRLLGTEGDAVRLRMEDSEVVLPYADIRRAKLVLTEELLATGGH